MFDSLAPVRRQQAPARGHIYLLAFLHLETCSRADMQLEAELLLQLGRVLIEYADGRATHRAHSHNRNVHDGNS